jgi:hypothetical protein
LRKKSSLGEWDLAVSEIREKGKKEKKGKGGKWAARERKE